MRSPEEKMGLMKYLIDDYRRWVSGEAYRELGVREGAPGGKVRKLRPEVGDIFALYTGTLPLYVMVVEEDEEFPTAVVVTPQYEFAGKEDVIFKFDNPESSRWAAVKSLVFSIYRPFISASFYLGRPSEEEVGIVLKGLKGEEVPAGRTGIDTEYAREFREIEKERVKPFLLATVSTFTEEVSSIALPEPFLLTIEEAGKVPMAAAAKERVVDTPFGYVVEEGNNVTLVFKEEIAGKVGVIKVPTDRGDLPIYYGELRPIEFVNLPERVRKAMKNLKVEVEGEV